MPTPSRVAWGLVAIVAAVVLTGVGALLFWRISAIHKRNTLVLAVSSGDVETVRGLLARSARTNIPLSEGTTLLEVATFFYKSRSHPENDLRHAEIVRLLIAHGADPRVRNPRTGDTALLSAALGSKTATAEALLDGGADPNAQDYELRMTPLLWAARNGNVALARSLIAHGASVRAKSKGNITVLMEAAAGGSSTLVKLVLAHGADVKARTEQKKLTAIDFARLHHHPELAPLLREAGVPE